MSRELQVLAVGAGFSGIYLTHLMSNVHGYKIRAFEMSDQPGGTWNWNRYPGARVDNASRDYSFKFDKDLYDEWNWSEVYAPQPELMTYVHHLIKRYNLSPHLQFNSRVSSCVWSDDEGKWTVTVDNKESGEKEVWKAKYLVWCTGCLSSPNIPTFPGSEEFKGQLYHTGLWPRDKVDFKGKRVAVIGTGSSGIQTIPVVAADAASLTCFQRTPTYSIPAWNRPVTPEELAEAKADSQALRKRALTHELGNPCLYYTPRLYSDFSPSEIEPHLEMVWNLGGANMYGVWADMLTDKKANEVASEFVRRKIRETVKDKETAELLCPDYPLGCKRICVDTNYYATYNLPHVKLVSIKSNPFKSVGPNDKITLSDGSEYGPFDIIVSATGFDAITGAISKVDVTGRGGLTLKKAWEEGPVNYLGRFVHGFPNMFMITGPGSPGVLTCMINTIEFDVEWLIKAIKKFDAEGVKQFEADEKYQDDWVQHVNDVADGTLFKSCNSWYIGANVVGKKQVFMPLIGLPGWVTKSNEVADKEYEGLVLTKA